MIFGVTGTGWLDPDAINSIEAVIGGAVTTVAVQHSSVPSWIGFLLDPVTTQSQNTDTTNAVIYAWRTKPVDERPELILFGESLGAFGTQAAWSANQTPETASADVKRIILVEPPSQSVLWKQWQADRTKWTGLATVGTGRSITFVAHPDDPVVYRSPSLLLQPPDWLDAPLGLDKWWQRPT